MKRVYNILFVAASVWLSLAVSGCTKNFDELNRNPYWLRQNDMTIDDFIATLMPAMVNTTFLSQQNRFQHTELMLGQFGGQVATTAPWNGSNFANFNPPQTWVDIPWTDVSTTFYANYLTLLELFDTKKIVKENDYRYHWLNIIKVASQHRLADIYGPMPYSKIKSGESSFNVEFDSVKDAYIAMINDLSAAVASLTEVTVSSASSEVRMGKGDYVYHAETGALLVKWVKFANSLKLRLAVRIALMPETADFAKTSIEEVMTHPIGPIVSNADNAFNSATPDNTSNGFFASTTWGDMKVNAVATTYMNAFKDPRISKYMRTGTRTAPEDYSKNIGARMGVVTNSNSVFFDFDIDPFVAPETYSIFYVTQITDPVMLFCAAETQFLLAEAAERGWYTGGSSAETYYNEGIRLSLQQHGADGDLTAYMAETMTAAEGVYSDPRDTSSNFDIFSSFTDLGSGADPITVAYPASGMIEQKIEAIITQKWLANWGLGVESWSEWRRTGYPRMFPAMNDNSGGAVNNPTSAIDPAASRMMRRLRYPVSVNSSEIGYPQAMEHLGGADNMTTDLWWAKSNQS